MSSPRRVVRAPEPEPIRANAVAATGDDQCPRCGTSLVGEPIAEDAQHLYGKATHFRREVHVIPEDGSRVMFYVCPDCHGAWGPSFKNAVGEWAEQGPALTAAAIETHHADVALLADRDHVAQVLAEERETIVFALGLAGCRWVGWTFAQQTGARLHLIVEPVLGAAHPASETTRMIGNATGWPARLIDVLSRTSPMVRLAHEEDLRHFAPAPTTAAD